MNRPDDNLNEQVGYRMQESKFLSLLIATLYFLGVFEPSYAALAATLGLIITILNIVD